MKVEIDYNPYKMETDIRVDGNNIYDLSEYVQFKEFIKIGMPLQTWIEPIPYKNWKGILNELSEDDCYNEIEFIFYGRKIDFDDLKRSCEAANEMRKHKLGISYILENELSDKKMAQNIDVVSGELLSDRFAQLVKEHGEGTSVAKTYANLEKDYQIAKDSEFKIIFAGVYSSGKSTILNALIRRNILPTSDKTCTAKICRIKHNKNLKNRISLECFDKEMNVVVEKEFFDSDEDCLKRFKEITPIPPEKCNPETIHTIEICLDISHLYPSKEMEREFNLVIVDTPGSDSMETNEFSADSKQIENAHEQMTIDAITGQEKEMVVICVDAEKNTPTSLGQLLKGIRDSSKEDNGSFNDRFLFVLNKGDKPQYVDDETAKDLKENFAKKIMDAKRWGIVEDNNSVKFIPRVFMISPYIDIAIRQGVTGFSTEELQNNLYKRNWKKAFCTFNENVLHYKDKNYFLSELCDIPEYRKKEFE